METEPSSSAQVYDFLGWLEQNRNKIAAVLVAVAVVAIVVAVVRAGKEKRETAANAAFFSLPLDIIADESAEAASAGDFLTVAEDFSSTPVGGLSLLMAARGYFIDGDYGNAETHFSRFLTDNPLHEFAPIAALGIAASLEASGQVQEAIARYESVISQYPNDIAGAQAQYQAGRLYQNQGNVEEALRHYDGLIGDETEDGHNHHAHYWIDQASMKRELIYRANPELRPDDVPVEEAFPMSMDGIDLQEIIRNSMGGPAE